MPNTRDIRNRIKSVKNTAQITRAMQLVAASKTKRAQDAALQGRPYAALLAQMLISLHGSLSGLRHPFLEKRPVHSRGILLLSSNKGLCGSLNANLFRLLPKIEPEVKFVSVGRKGTQFIARTRRRLLADFTVSDSVPFAEVRPVVDFMLKTFQDGKIDTIEVLYPRFKNTLIQEPSLIPLLPLDSLEKVLDSVLKVAGIEKTSEDNREMLFEPGPAILLDPLLKLYLKELIYQRILESKASEHSARMVAMKSATDNANNLLDELTLEYNKLRQASITQEILEISAVAFTAA